MIKKRKIRSTLVVLFALLALVASACSSSSGEGDATTTTTAAPAAGETATVRVIMEEVPDTDIVSAMVADFNAVYPDITIEIEAMPYDQMRDRVVSSFLASDPTFDLIIVDNPWMYDFASAGFLEDLTSRISSTDGYDYEDFSEPLRTIAEVDGGIFGIPFYNYGLSLIYRADLYEAAGLEAPTSLEEFGAAAAALTTADMAGIAMQPQKGYKIFEEWANYLFAAGGAIQDADNKVILDSPEARTALETYIEFYNSYAPQNSLNWSFDESLRAVAGGQAAQMISYNWMLPTLNSPDGPAGDLTGEFKVAEVPGGKSVLGAWYWSLPENSNVKDAAWTFVSWISGKEQATARVIAGGAPVRASVMNDPDVWSQGFGEEYYTTVAAILEDAMPLADGPNAEEMINVVGEELNAAVAGQKSVDAAITDAAARAQEVLNQGG
ncbi:Maltose/maltodextrin ABC transporter, substrate binding periplasmic protein MalE [hydrothermal vent metagenome]|uniref:Maltose/maltodextrin ABC transporter, substrate binding periplasmic protein MalE n=1 Tax=hydrothermal vent metagenome TaxID=652676 RepID=A0A3B0SY84_9ZZZZ